MPLRLTSNQIKEMTEKRNAKTKAWLKKRKNMSNNRKKPNTRPSTASILKSKPRSTSTVAARRAAYIASLKQRKNNNLSISRNNTRRMVQNNEGTMRRNNTRRMVQNNGRMHNTRRMKKNNSYNILNNKGIFPAAHPRPSKNNPNTFRSTKFGRRLTAARYL